MRGVCEALVASLQRAFVRLHSIGANGSIDANGANSDGVYHDDNDVVFIDSQWLADAFACVITDNVDQYRRFGERVGHIKGDDRSLQCLWSDETKFPRQVHRHREWGTPTA